MRQPWIHSAPLDLAGILGPPFLSVIAVLGLRALTGQAGGGLEPWMWVLLVVGVDVAHVYSTLYRTYLDPAETRARPGLYLGAPLAAWVGGILLHSMGAMVFWRALAYLAVFHFVRQQYGFMMIYSREDDEAFRRWRWLDRLAIYLATIYPLAWWHTHLPREISWFVAGDFVPLPWPALERVAHLAWTAALAGYVAKEAALSWRLGRFNLPRNLLLLGTAVAWYAGIVGLEGDLAFTATNVVSHGVPYVALVWALGRRRAAEAPGERLRGGLTRAQVFSLAALPLFAGLLLGLAFVEEGLWDALVWRDHPTVFGAFWAIPKVLDRATLAWLVPTLALPQSTHYVIDGFIWRLRPAPGAQAVAGGEPGSAAPLAAWARELFGGKPGEAMGEAR